GGFSDSPGDPPTAHSLDLGISLCWELDLFGDLAVDLASIHRFLDRCRPQDGEGFCPRPEASRSSEACTTTTALVVRILKRMDRGSPDFPAEHLTKEAIRFLTRERWNLGSFFSRMQTDEGGLRVFPSQKPSLSATAFALQALLFANEPQWAPHHKKGLIHF